MANKEIDEHWEKEFGKKFSEMSREEQEKRMYDSPRTPFVRFKELHFKVTCLIDFINILNELEPKYFTSLYTRSLKDIGSNPAVFLTEYVILEISNFYTLAHSEKSVNLPEPPEYWKKLKDFRNVIPAHADKDREFKTNRDLKKVIYNPMDELGLGKILKDFYDYFAKCVDIFLNKQNVEF